MQQNLQALEDTTSLHRSLKQARDRNDELSQQLHRALEQALDAQQAADAAEKRCTKAQAALNAAVTSHVHKVRADGLVTPLDHGFSQCSANQGAAPEGISIQLRHQEFNQNLLLDVKLWKGSSTDAGHEQRSACRAAAVGLLLW
jgi:hypothetical protein